MLKSPSIKHLRSDKWMVPVQKLLKFIKKLPLGPIRWIVDYAYYQVLRFHPNILNSIDS